MMLKILIKSFLLIGSCYLTVSLDRQCNIANLAVNKTSVQHTTFSGEPKANYTSGKAVDGNFTNGESRTEEQSDEWLRIDLGQSQSIGVVELYTPKLSRISLLTSNDANPSAPSLDDPDTRKFNGPWTEQVYHEEAYREVGIIQLQGIYARHLAIFSTGTLGVSLVEMMVFSDMCYNLAEIKTTSQSTTMKSNFSQYGNDGCLSTFSITNEADRQYWMVTLGASHVIYKVVIHRKFLAYDSQYANWSIVTNGRDSEVPGPSSTGDMTKREFSHGWQEVYFMPTTYDDKDIYFKSVSARHVAVFNVNNLYGILLRELQVFGCQCELQEIIGQFRIKPSKNPGCVTLSWNITHQYCSTSEFKYEYQCQDEESWISAPNEFSGDVCYLPYGTLVTCNVRACLGTYYCYSNKIHASSSPEKYEMELIIVSAVESSIIFVAIIVIACLCRNRTRSFKDVCKEIFRCPGCKRKEGYEGMMDEGNA